MQGFNIQQQKEFTKSQDEAVDVHLHDLNGEPMFYYDEEQNAFPVTLSVTGTHSSHYRRAEEAMRKRKLSRRTLTAEQIYEDAIAKAVACTHGWDGFLDDNGEKLPFTKDGIRAIYKEFPWVYEQAAEAMQDHASFFSTESGS